MSVAILIELSRVITLLMLLNKTVSDHKLEPSATQCVGSTGDLYWKGVHRGLRLDTEYPQ